MGNVTNFIIFINKEFCVFNKTEMELNVERRTHGNFIINCILNSTMQNVIKLYIHKFPYRIIIVADVFIKFINVIVKANKPVVWEDITWQRFFLISTQILQY